MSLLGLDGFVTVLVLLAAWRGWRRGLLATVASVAGLVAGAVLGSRAAAWLIRALGLDDSVRVPVSIAVVIGCALTASSIGGFLGQRLRSRVTWRPAAVVDNLAGAGFDAAAVMVVVWMLASAVSVVPSPVSRDVSASRVIRAIDSTMPSSMDALFAQLVKSLDNSGVPRVFFSFGGVRAPVSGSASDAVATAAAVRRAAASVVRVSGEPRGCGGTVVGSGFVIAPGRVLTNAHVVAGLSKVRVEAGDNRYRLGSVVFFDPDVDVAVVKVDTSGWPALRMSNHPPLASSTAVIGYPGGGPKEVVPALVIDIFRARGSDIYGGGAVTRSVIALRSTVRQGDSGGALVDTAGEVRGVIFAVSRDDASTGYALDPAEVSGAVRAAAGAARTVSTGVCAAHE